MKQPNLAKPAARRPGLPPALRHAFGDLDNKVAARGRAHGSMLTAFRAVRTVGGAGKRHIRGHRQLADSTSSPSRIQHASASRLDAAAAVTATSSPSLESIAAERAQPLRPARTTSEDPGEMVIQPSAAHTHTVILLHGMYCTPEESNLYKALPAYLGFLGAGAGIKFVFPRAPRRTITWPGEPEAYVASWYNYFTRRDGEDEHDEIDQATLRAMPHHVSRLLSCSLLRMRSAVTRWDFSSLPSSL